MVLTRLSTRVTLIALLHAVTVGAQQNAPPSLKQTGEMRPMLYGFALECIDCAPGEGARGRGRGGAPVVWSYRRFPHVIAVAPASAAEQAGVKAGDVLQSIDGKSVLTDAGATRLAHATEGEQVKLLFERDSKPIEISLVLGASAARKPGSGPARIGNGYVVLHMGPGEWKGEMNMEIWSDDPIISTDSVSDVDRTAVVVLKIGTNTVIRLKLKKDSTDSGGGKSGRGKPDETREPSHP